MKDPGNEVGIRFRPGCQIGPVIVIWPMLPFSIACTVFAQGNMLGIYSLPLNSTPWEEPLY